jgi:hypothetical protein
MQVSHETVLQARAALLGEAVRLRQAIHMHAAEEGVGLCGGDPVSSDAAPAFNERIAALLGHCWQYTASLEDSAHSLGEIARRYGFTEAEIAASFTS